MKRRNTGHTSEKTSVALLVYLFFLLVSHLQTPFFCGNFEPVVAALGFIPKIPELETRAQGSLGLHIPINAAETSVKT